MPGGLILHCLKLLNSDIGFESICVSIFSSSMIFHNISQFKSSYTYPKGSEDIHDSNVDNSANGKTYIRKGCKLPCGINHKTKELDYTYKRNIIYENVSCNGTLPQVAKKLANASLILLAANSGFPGILRSGRKEDRSF